MRTLLSFTLLVSLLLTACGGGGSNDGDGNPPPPSLNVNGNWQMWAISEVVSDYRTEVVVRLSNSGNSVTAHARLLSDCFNVEDVVTMTGTVSNGLVTLTGPAINGQTVTLNGSLNNNGISGDYSIAGGCADGDAGRLEGFKVPSFTGNWSGSFSSVPAPGTPTSVTATLTEGSEDPGFLGLTLVTGTVNFPDSTCFDGGTITNPNGDVFGTNILLWIGTDDGGAVLFSGTLDSEFGAEITGEYQITGGNCDGDFGTGTITRQ